MARPAGVHRAAFTAAEADTGTLSPQAAVIEMTGVGIVTGWNPVAEFLYGYPAEEIVGRHADVFCPPAGRALEAAVLQRIVSGGGGEQYEADRVREDGKTIRVLVTAEPIAGPTGAIVGVNVVSCELLGQRDHADTTEETDASETPADAQRRDERDTLERKERLRAQAQRLESLGQLAGGVAHDFNNLLAVILNYVSFVSEEVAAAAADPEPARHLEAASADLEQIKKAAERAARLTHQLLVFARRDVIRP
ncbi:MAG: PAS domain S-box protein, partial [Kibdelosporangium sp.]